MMHPLRKAAMALPLSPGVYLMKNAEGKIIYIGKAKALKNRVSQYFGADTGHSEKTKRMVAQVEKFDTIVTDSEFEALVLECSLIKQYSPKYNILLKDDKGYHYIRVSPPPYARIEACKQLADDGARYLGPYVSSFTVRESVEEAQKIFQLPTCQQPLAFGKARGRSCLNHAIHQCCAPCTGRVPEEEYAERVAQAVTFLTQGSAAIHEKLTEQMEAAAERLDFEKAARLRDRVHAIDRLAQRQKVVMSRVREQDVVAAVQSGDTLCFEVFRFTGGNLTDQEHFFAEAGDTLEGARAAFVQQYYAMRERVPPLVALDGACEDTPLLEQFLSEKAGRHVHITVPQKGEQARLTALCRQNAAEKLAQKLGLSGRDAAALDELARLLGLPKPPVLIECFDISHTAGSAMVAGMVVFENGRPLKKMYKRFQIDTPPADDYAAMRDVVARRLAHKDDSAFGPLPDLLLVDGGKGHVAAVKSVLGDAQIPVFGLVKDERHRTRAVAGEQEIVIAANRRVFTLLSAIQEEVHRFAIAYHHKKTQKNTLTTALTSLDGVGPVLTKALLQHFGSLKKIKEASAVELCAVRGVSKQRAEKLVGQLKEIEI